MFRQIGVEPVDQPYQSILWRFDKSELIQTYQLTTVTYGLVCTQLKLFDQKCIQIMCFLVHSFEEALQKQDELIQLFKQGHLNLRKWTSNNAEVLS